jgi:hypothetical protein
MHCKATPGTSHLVNKAAPYSLVQILNREPPPVLPITDATPGDGWELDPLLILRRSSGCYTPRELPIVEVEIPYRGPPPALPIAAASPLKDGYLTLFLSRGGCYHPRGLATVPCVLYVHVTSSFHSDAPGAQCMWTLEWSRAPDGTSRAYSRLKRNPYLFS